MNNVESQNTEVKKENLNLNEVPKDLENKLNNADPKEIAKNLDKNVTLPDGGNGLPDHDPVTRKIEKNKIGEREKKWPEIPIKEVNQYTKTMLDIKNLKSGDSNIPEENRVAIINAINKLWEFQKLKIVGCTDASKINTLDVIERNKKQFDEIRNRYLAKGWTCPIYDELIKSTEDWQNTILWYARAMQWILSLNLTPDQIRKVEIGNKLWTKENYGQERWFDVETNYTEEIVHTIHGLVYENIYGIFGDLSKNNIGRYRWSDDTYSYGILKMDISTSGNFQKLYQDVFIGTKSFVWENNPIMENKIKQQTTNFLNHLIDGYGTKSFNNISNKMYYLIRASDSEKWFLTKEEFVDVVKNGNLSVLENKKLDGWSTLKDFVNQNNIVSVYKPSWGMYFYNTTNKELANTPSKRKLSWNDFYKIALYFEMKNSPKN